MSDPLESLLVDGPTTPLDELYRAITLAHGLNDAEREKLRAAARASLEAAEAAATEATIEQAVRVCRAKSEHWQMLSGSGHDAEGRRRAGAVEDALNDCGNAIAALLPGDAAGGE